MAHQSTLPAPLHQAVTAIIGAEPQNLTYVSGGMINRAVRFDVAGDSLFLKWNEKSPPNFFTAEAQGLRLLHSTGTVRVPEVLEVCDNPAFLMLEYIAPQRPADQQRFTRSFAEALAQLHGTTSSTFGLDEDNYIGSLPQSNTRCSSWPEFYRECRLLPQITRARRAGVLRVELERLLMKLVEKLDDLLTNLPSHPALLHGDLWSGNFMSAGDTPVVFDPAVYYGEREVEMAFVELFGGFPRGFIEAYLSELPLDDGYEYRRPLHQLYPLLVHLNIFGEAYGADIESVCRRNV